jgi:hypothetical protein
MGQDGNRENGQKKKKENKKKEREKKNVERQIQNGRRTDPRPAGGGSRRASAV